ncbi:MAG: 2-phospho-L-lactate transferase CofD family protein [Clostridia bacterium]
MVKSKAKKVFISNLMNSPGETDGYTLARHVNEIERYLGKHVLDYVIANSGEITDEMVKDFNQGFSSQVTLDIENIQNRAISVINEDLVLTAPSSIIHNSNKVTDIIIAIAKTKKIGKLNIVSLKKKHLRNEKRLTNNILKNKINDIKISLKNKTNDRNNRSKEKKVIKKVKAGK